MTKTKLDDVKAVVFDLDETLVDTTKSQWLANKYAAKTLSNFLSSKGVHASQHSLCRTIEKLASEMDLKSVYDRDIWWKKILKKMNLTEPISGLFFIKLTQGYWAQYTKGMVKYRDTLPTLKYLKKKEYKLGLITNTDGTPGIKAKRISRSGFQRLFDVIVIAGEETRKPKPNPSSYILALKKLHLEAYEVVYVGDKPFTDIKGAKTSGMIGILVRRKSWKRQIKPDFAIGNLIELKNIL